MNRELRKAAAEYLSQIRRVVPPGNHIRNEARWLVEDILNGDWFWAMHDVLSLSAYSCIYDIAEARFATRRFLDKARKAYRRAQHGRDSDRRAISV